MNGYGYEPSVVRTRIATLSAMPGKGVLTVSVDSKAPRSCFSVSTSQANRSRCPSPYNITKDDTHKSWNISTPKGDTPLFKSLICNLGMPLYHSKPRKKSLQASVENGFTIEGTVENVSFGYPNFRPRPILRLILQSILDRILD